MWLQLAVVCVAAFALGMGATYLWQRQVGTRGVPPTHPVIGAACGALASFYVLTIAFLIVNTSSGLADGSRTSLAEAGAIRDAFLASADLSPAERQSVQGDLRGYTHRVADVEWPMLAKGQADTGAWDQLDSLHELALRVGGASNSAAVTELQADVAQIYVHRRERVAASRQGVPDLLLGFLLATAVLVPFSFLLVGWPPGARAGIAMGVLVMLFAAGIWIVVQLNHPFAGDIRVGPAAFRDALARMDHMQALFEARR